MLEGNFIKIKQSFLQYLPFGFFIGVVILLELVLIIGSWQYRPEFIKTALSPCLSWRKVRAT